MGSTLDQNTLAITETVFHVHIIKMQSLCYAALLCFYSFFTIHRCLWLVQIFSSVLQALPRGAKAACVYVVEGCPTSTLCLFHILLRGRKIKIISHRGLSLISVPSPNSVEINRNSAPTQGESGSCLSSPLGLFLVLKLQLKRYLGAWSLTVPKAKGRTS